MSPSKTVWVKRLSDGQIFSVPEGHHSINDDRFEVIEPEEAKPEPKKRGRKPKATE